MHILTAAKEGPLRLAQSLVIIVLAGLLVFYHAVTLSEFARWHDSSSAAYDVLQGFLRIAIMASLTLVVLGKRWALWTMWCSIGGLVATHYWAHFGFVEADFTAGRHPLSYLKGFIFPSIITAAFLYRRSDTGKVQA